MGSLGETILTSVRRRLFSVSLDLHAAGDAGVGLSPRKVSHVDEGVVEGGEDVTDAEDVLGLLSSADHGGSVVSDLFLLGGLSLGAFLSSLLAFTLSFGLNSR